MPSPEFPIVMTDTVLEHLGHLQETLGDEAEAIASALVGALRRLREQEFAEPSLVEFDQVFALEDPLSVEPYGTYGDTFLCNFHPEYAFVFRKETQRDAAKQPQRVIVQVLALLRRP